MMKCIKECKLRKLYCIEIDVILNLLYFVLTDAIYFCAPTVVGLCILNVSSTGAISSNKNYVLLFYMQRCTTRRMWFDFIWVIQGWGVFCFAVNMDIGRGGTHFQLPSS
jgi:hypothetical protein